MTKIYRKNFQNIIDIYHHRMTNVNKAIIKIYNILYIFKCLIFKKSQNYNLFSNNYGGLKFISFGF